MLTLITFPGGFGQPSHSPFCVKVMGLLRLAERGWRPKYVSNPAKMPLGRLPVLKTGDRLIPDSYIIQAWLEGQGVDFFPGLDDRARAHAHALIRMTEENLRLGLVHERWLNDSCWDIMREAFFEDVPSLLRKPISNAVRKKARTDLIAHGIAQFTEHDRRARLRYDLDAIQSQLQDKEFLFGQTPTAADAAIVPVLDGLNCLPVDTGVRRIVRDMPDLVAYVRRGRGALYPEDDEMALAA
ncbi:Glutathione S-transferase [Shimia gijangensis]|uniref:Glutathione S-transferase n=1 Tax=Shimia gijangensis TaxID=1470563 RepID=A0A1M6QML5_9RHOB|nr:glutathione S-transferase family protein [Shimia gijangensis]SHK21340.1 Glutathione S-transferase [Shimia gijangensis]